MREKPDLFLLQTAKDPGSSWPHLRLSDPEGDDLPQSASYEAAPPKTILHIDDALPDPLAKSVFHGPRHGCRGLAATDHENTCKGLKVKHGLRFTFLIEEKVVSVEPDKAPYRFIGVNSFQGSAKKAPELGIASCLGDPLTPLPFPILPILPFIGFSRSRHPPA